MDGTESEKSWLWQKFTIPQRAPDTRCQARIRVNGQETYCQVEAGGERCAEHDVNKKRQAARDSDEQRSFDEETAVVDERDETLWEELPVSPKEFFDTFVNEPLFPIQQEFVDAMLGTDPRVWDTHYSEGIALWGKGSGKDKTAAKIMTYAVYKLLCLKHPHRYLGLSDLDKVELANVAINARQAKDVFFWYFKAIVRRTRNPKTRQNWFIEKGLNLQRDIKGREITFPKDITAHSLDSEEYTGEGLNLLLVTLDEVGGFETRVARELYFALRTTARSRFPHQMKLLLLSYKRDDNDYMMTRFREAEQERATFRSGPWATWEVNPKCKKEDYLGDYEMGPEMAKRVYECR